jgi:hypothetical protein
MEVSSLHGDGFWKGVQEDKYETRQVEGWTSTMFWSEKWIMFLSFET